LYVSVSCERAERDVCVVDLDAAQLVQVPDVDVIAMRELAGFE